MKILVAVDGSRYTKRMLAYLAAHDEWLGAHHQYVVIHSVAAVPSRAVAFLGQDVLSSYYADEAEKVLKSIRTFFKRQNLNAEFISKVGPPHEMILKVAKSGKFDLLVMGSRGHSALGSMVMGSVAVKVLAQSEMPVLLIR